MFWKKCLKQQIGEWMKGKIFCIKFGEKYVNILSIIIFGCGTVFVSQCTDGFFKALDPSFRDKIIVWVNLI